MSVIEIAKSSNSITVNATSDDVTSEIWFKSDPVDQKFIFRAIQLQLQTDSCDQGQSELDSATNGWSGFELVIFRDQHTNEPRTKDGKPLAWRSHGNRLDPLDQGNAVSRHYGVVFDRRQDLLDALELGNVIGVRVCAKNAGWVNDARSDIFSPMSWTLSSQDTPDDIPDSIENGVYSLIPTTGCHVKCTTDEQVDTVWFTTPVLDKEIIPRIEDIQLFTHAHHENPPADDAKGIWCWFDLIVLENSSSTQPRVKDGRALVWRSHNIPRDATKTIEQVGKLLGRDHDLLGLIEPGNVIAVRACARFPGWELDAHTARLVVRISNKGVHRAASKSKVDWKAVERSNQKLQETLAEYLDNVTPVGDAPALSVETTLLAQELRTDRAYGSGGKPLKLLSLDGGGVRGISSLYTLKALMSKLTGDPNAKPCDYFDMMAGTSTGGIIAIMLGRLRMTVDQCIDVYNDLSSKIFAAGILSQVGSGATTGARYSSQVLEDSIKAIVKKHAGDADAPMLDPNQDGCKVFVLATRADDLSNRVATHLRTYVNNNVEKSFEHYKIWEAARATSAAPTYFPRMKLDEYEYVDGGLGFNNPVLLLMGEARLHFGFARPFGCLVTIGTGMAPNVELPPEGTNVFNSVTSSVGIVKSMWELTTKAEHANQMAKPLCEPGTYYRFNVGEKIAEKRWVEKVDPPLFQRWFSGAQPIEVQRVTAENWANITIDLADYKHMGDFVRITLRYLETEDKRVKECASKLPPKRVPVQV
ncbi:acyl transferase/acyl hydrolase/lysophospholipase [Panaeolus papilionaceus]|nr:acyl transferase/acyl hydrolase/lysophospholipase [Panaeolus papilionaceus]